MPYSSFLLHRTLNSCRAAIMMPFFSRSRSPVPSGSSGSSGANLTDVLLQADAASKSIPAASLSSQDSIEPMANNLQNSGLFRSIRSISNSIPGTYFFSHTAQLSTAHLKKHTHSSAQHSLASHYVFLPCKTYTMQFAYHHTQMPPYLV